MAVENQITLVGNLADDPELRYTPQGVAVANIRVAVNRRKRNPQTNEWEDALDGFFTCNVWREMAENVAESLHKGTRVVVVGRLRTRQFEDREGQSRSVTEVEVDEVSPSLRWARASVTRNPRGGGGGGGQTGGDAGAGSDRSGDGGGGDTSWSGGSQPPSAPDTDDVPF